MAFGLIVAAGVGDRLGAPVPKFEVPLGGRPMVIHSLEAFQRAPCVEGVVLVVPPDRLDEWTIDRLRELGIDKAWAVAGGGASRQESVWRGLQLLGETGEVVVHDAARPLVTPALIERTFEMLSRAPGAITAIPVTDTLKEVASEEVLQTVAREALVSVQTPQAFRLEVLKRAHLRALQDGFAGTDDASLLERLGEPVLVVESDRYNIKVTYPEDLAFAEFLMSSRSRP
ncbi:MAG: 2-C-methyl-D-erythritol 4-phosphate cytidylyltransferase [Actinobacteria bacterium]|nr:2-C-methyl-D-erythritol 4-phosphate cytidylyltransferase [Actinomycetota bacterium]MBU2686681.1 2-C-methyl-D-erythritol 4-phosphate cytidylyltransferase [Actinomycetota bacterium]